MILKRRLLTLLFVIATAIGTEAQTIAFPEAEGFGKFASGGRGGRVIEVTNLLDLDRRGNTPEGSLREALNTPGDDPITIVFKVSGLIDLTTELKSDRSNMTIAGQTAPGDGICIKGQTIKLSGENLIIRYVRFRPGDERGAETSSLNIENAKNIIIDHCSMSWAVEEIMGFYDNINTTVQWCILSEGLYNSVDSKGARSYAAQWGGQYASYHHNLLAHNYSRSPRINGSQSNDSIALLDVRNNVIYNWGSQGAVYGGEEAIEGGRCETNFVNNYYQPGKMTSSTLLFARPSYKRENVPATGFASWYFSGNYMAGIEGGMNEDNWLGVGIISEIGSADNIRAEAEFEVSTVTTQSAMEARELVLNQAGATLPKRDPVDLRIIGEARGNIAVQGNGRIDSPAEVGGWPDYNSLYPLPDTDHDGMPDEYETANGLDPNNPSDGAIILETGYSNLENYLNSITGIHGTEEEPTVVLGVKKNDVLVYPNPTADDFMIRSIDLILLIEVYTLTGQKVLRVNPDSREFSIDLGNQPKGIYLVKILKEDGLIDEFKLTKK